MTTRLLVTTVGALLLLGCTDDPTPGGDPNNPPTDVSGFGRVASVCIDGFRVFIADHEQVGYGVAAVADPTCEDPQ